MLNYSDLNYPNKIGYTSQHYNMHTESNSTVHLIIDAIPDNNSLFVSGKPILFLLVFSIVAVVAVIVVSFFMYYKRGKR